MPRKSKLVDNFKDFANRSTIHGLGYIFDGHSRFLDRGLWLAIVIGSMSFAILMIISSYTTWQADQVITTLKTTTKSVKDLHFPSVTICADGLHMDLVEKVLYNDFIKWKPTNSNDSLEDELSMFMLEMFLIQDNGTNILDILNTMVSPETSVANAVRKNQMACAKNKKRKRRDTGEYYKTFINSYSW